MPHRLSRHRLPHLIFVLAMAGVLALLAYAAVIPHTDRPLTSNQPRSFAEGWTYVGTDGTTRVISLDEQNRLEPNTKGGIRLTHLLPDDQDITIALYVNTQRYKVFVDGQFVSESADAYHMQGYYDKSDGDFWYLVKLPSSSGSKVLTLVISSPYEQDQNLAQATILIGLRSSIVNYILSSHATQLVLGFLMIGLGLLCLAYFVTLRLRRQPVSASLAYLVATTVCVGAYVLASSHSLQIFTSNGYLVNALAYLSIYGGTMCTTMYLVTAAGRRWQGWNSFLFVASVCLWVVSTCLQLSRVADYRETIVALHVLLATIAVTSVVELLHAVLVEHDRSQIFTLVLLALFGTFAALEMTGFYAGGGTIVDSLRVPLITCLVVLMVARELWSITNTTRMAAQGERYRDLADHDSMTGLLNHGAFERWIDERADALSAADAASDSPGTAGRGLYALMIDVDRLKHINDDHGHEAGDQAICAVADCLLATFGEVGVCARTGGDEFACVLTLRRETDDVNALVDAFKDRLSQRAGQLPFALSASVGVARFDPAQDDSLADALRRADAAMYEAKRSAHACRA